ncbi:chemotaxis protein CheB [Crateriforma conspicua]|uniref:Autoinducer 2 sensor kinase/phosphatase LuxQ n=1 Tax=Crateriforma conspicua TaxID=2527996 RepID=A0A5C5Y2P6_9PLAN|nr:chemotaxis protein CheB [Crateriforma conspicua]TWT68953.1 Autoinducer 2 sensor kinase/phosphatase LuxQ [Crateriforma conspicua]
MTEAASTPSSSETSGGSGSIQHHVVGVGASAGGLEALETLFRNMPLDTGMSFVVIQHLSPEFKSHMDQLLQRVTDIPVEVVDDGVDVRPNKIYLIPPKMEMIVSGGKLLLTERSREKVLSHPIDQFFRSLSQDAGRLAVGIILSGTGSDGSRGISEIAANDGLTVVQDPATCKFDAMPLNAQETGHVHLVLSPESMGDMLIKYSSGDFSPGQLRDEADEPLDEKGISRVFQLLQQNHGIDFSHYKSGTVGRRVQRRIELLHLDNVEHYVQYIDSHPSEVNDLYKDLLIGVTRFFRDIEAYEVLENVVIPELLAKCGDQLRVWVCGCATGEEAYSLAMLIQEALDRGGRDVDFKIFATDAHRQSLQFAAAGVYDEPRMKDVSPKRRKRFFHERRDGFFVNNDLRRRVVFAPHNIINDPPFTQMDLVTCRNLLIYLQNPAQRKTLSLFHFALRPGGVLFLGPSETAGEISDEFEFIDVHWKIFRKRRDIRLPIDTRMTMLGDLPLRSAGITRTSGTASPPPRRNTEMLSEAYDILLGELMQPSVLVDAQCRILHIFAGADPFLRLPSGRPSMNLMEMVYPEAKNSIAAAVQHALKDGQTVKYSGLRHPDPDGDSQVRLVVRPIKLPVQRDLCLLVQFETTEKLAINRSDDEGFNEVVASELAASRIESLERELDYTRQNLQATIEELETSNEELQATNEEMVAANEELQSTNEELHSVNEELFTVNAEHQARVAELDEANADMNNLLANTRVGVLFLDNHFHIRRFTPEVGRLLFMEEHDIGRSIDGFINRIDDPKFVDHLDEIRQSGQEREWEIRVGGAAYLARALPYWRNHECDGVIVSFINIETLRQTEQEVIQFKFMVDGSVDGQLLIDKNANVSYANRQACKLLGCSPDSVDDLSVLRFEVAQSQHDFFRRFDDVHRSGGETVESVFRRIDDATEFPVEISYTPVTLRNQPFVMASVRDITVRQQRQREMQLLSKAVGSAANGIIVTDVNLPDNPITFVNEGFCKMTGYSEEEVLGRNCRFLQGPDTDKTAIAEIRKGVHDGKAVRALLENYRKDGSKFWNDLYITPVENERGEVTHFVGIQNNVTDSIAAAEIARINERTIRSLLDSTAEGIFGINSSGNCTFCNNAAARMLGYKSGDDLVGRDMHTVVQPHDAHNVPMQRDDSAIIRSIKTGQPFHSENDAFCTRDAGCFPVEFWCHPISQDDEVVGSVVTFVDITERLVSEQNLKQARDEATAANEAKSRFLANMSHELRTPLAAMLGFTSILQEETDDESGAQEKLATIQRNGEYLLRLLGDVLDLSRIEADKFQTAKAIVSLDELLGDINTTMQMRTDEYETELHFHLKNPLPQTITTDSARLRQILINLIANGLKFSPKGRVDVFVREKCRAYQGKKVEFLSFTVQDNGIGISAEKLKTLFEPFVQADKSISERFGGTGLGLSITKRLVNALGGEMSVESEPGHGSTFSFEIPVAPVGERRELSLDAEDEHNDDATANREKSATQVIPLNAKVLIADDMRDVRFVAKHFLAKAKCKVDVAENGRQAVDMIVQAAESGDPFQLCLMDMHMPELDGAGAVKELRERGIELPVIALTADAMKGTRRRLIGIGFDEYLTKPLNVRKLMRIADQLLNS